MSATDRRRRIAHVVTKCLDSPVCDPDSTPPSTPCRPARTASPSCPRALTSRCATKCRRMLMPGTTVLAPDRAHAGTVEKMSDLGIASVQVNSAISRDEVRRAPRCRRALSERTPNGRCGVQPSYEPASGTFAPSVGSIEYFGTQRVLPLSPRSSRPPVPSGDHHRPWSLQADTRDDHDQHDARRESSDGQCLTPHVATASRCNRMGVNGLSDRYQRSVRKVTE
jgi:hypothetical protein